MLILAQAADMTGALAAYKARGGFARGVAGRHFAQARQFGHERRFDHRRRFVPGGFGFYDYDYPCSYGYPYSTSYSCYGYPPSYF
jgi:hypothetical protein